MATLTIRRLDEETKTRLRMRAAQHGHSMEAEARTILHDLLVPLKEASGLGSWIHTQFAEVENADLQLPARDQKPRAAVFYT